MSEQRGKEERGKGEEEEQRKRKERRTEAEINSKKKLIVSHIKTLVEYYAIFRNYRSDVDLSQFKLVEEGPEGRTLFVELKDMEISAINQFIDSHKLNPNFAIGRVLMEAKELTDEDKIELLSLQERRELASIQGIIVPKQFVVAPKKQEKAGIEQTERIQRSPNVEKIKILSEKVKQMIKNKIPLSNIMKALGIGENLAYYIIGLLNIKLNIRNVQIDETVNGDVLKRRILDKSNTIESIAERITLEKKWIYYLFGKYRREIQIESEDISQEQIMQIQTERLRDLLKNENPTDVLRLITELKQENSNPEHIEKLKILETFLLRKISQREGPFIKE